MRLVDIGDGGPLCREKGIVGMSLTLLCADTGSLRNPLILPCESTTSLCLVLAGRMILWGVFCLCPDQIMHCELIRRVRFHKKEKGNKDFVADLDRQSTGVKEKEQEAEKE